jgi:hypothetical protein
MQVGFVGRTSSRRRPPLAWLGDVAVGVVAALLVVTLPPFLTVGLVLGLAGLAFLTRFERVEDVAETFAILTALTMPMNRLLVGPIPISDFLLVAAVGLYILVRLVHGREPIAGNERTYRPIVIALTILGIGGLVGALFEVKGPFLYKALGEPVRDVSGWGQNIGNLMKFLLGSFVPMALWALVRPGRALMRKLIGAFTLGCCTSVLVGYALPGFRFGNRIGGLTVHPGQFGSLSLLGMGTALALLLTQPRFRLWGYAALPLLALGILGSGSRAALGGMVVLGLIIGPITGRRAVMGAVLVGAAAILVVFSLGVVKPEGENALGRALGGESSASGSSAIREDLGSRVFERWEQRPITGNGYNYMRPSHNVYLGLLGSAGVLGVLGLLTLEATIFRRAWRRRTDLLSACVVSGYAAYLTAAYFDNIFWWRWLWFYVGMVVAVLATRPGRDEPGYEEPARPVAAAAPVARSTR